VQQAFEDNWVRQLAVSAVYERTSGKTPHSVWQPVSFVELIIRSVKLLNEMGYDLEVPEHARLAGLLESARTNHYPHW